MSVSLIFILVATLLGIIQLLLGVALGLWIRRSDASATLQEESDLRRAQEIAQSLARMTSDLSQDVTRHQTQLESANDQLNAIERIEDQPLTSLVVGVVAEVLRANQTLQQRLTSAEEELQRRSAEIQSQVTKSLTDELTGLPNRRAFEQNLRKRLHGWHQHNVPFTLMLADIDHFKQVNDQHGHVAGDRVLATVAETLRAALRGPDAIARFGGEEFAVLLPYTSLEDAQHAARKTLTAVAAAVTRFDATELQVTCSIGVASPCNGEHGVELVKRADLALYASKEAGRDRGHFHDGISCVPIERTGGNLLPGQADPGASRGETALQFGQSPELDAALGDLRQCAEQLAHTAASPADKAI